jgi:hypothetical protein
MTLPRLGWAFNLLLHGTSMHAQPDAPPMQGRFPCILFSHGLGANRSTCLPMRSSPLPAALSAFLLSDARHQLQPLGHRVRFKRICRSLRRAQAHAPPPSPCPSSPSSLYLPDSAANSSSFARQRRQRQLQRQRDWRYHAVRLCCQPQRRIPTRMPCHTRLLSAISTGRSSRVTTQRNTNSGASRSLPQLFALVSNELIFGLEQVLQRVEELDSVLELVLASNRSPDQSRDTASESDVHVQSLESGMDAAATLHGAGGVSCSVGIASTLAPLLQVCPSFALPWLSRSTSNSLPASHRQHRRVPHQRRRWPRGFPPPPHPGQLTP